MIFLDSQWAKRAAECAIYIRWQCPGCQSKKNGRMVNLFPRNFLFADRCRFCGDLWAVLATLSWSTQDGCWDLRERCSPACQDRPKRPTLMELLFDESR